MGNNFEQIMKLLIASNNLPTKANPKAGAYNEQQISSLKNAGLNVEVVFFNRVDTGWFGYLQAFLSFPYRVKKINPDLIHIQYGGVFAALLVSRISKVPILVSFGGSDLIHSPNESWRVRTRLWVGIKASLYVLKRVQGVIVKSKNMLRELPSWVNLKNVWVVPNGVSLHRFQPMDKSECRKKLGWSDQNFNIMFSLYEHTTRRTKRMDLAEAAVEELRKNHIPAVLQRPNKIPHTEMPIWLNASDVFLLTSEHEGSPNIVKEALACNTPVVSTDVGDVAERMEGLQGCYLTTFDVKLIVEKLTTVYQNPINPNSREKIQADVSLEMTANRIIQIYHTIATEWKKNHE